MEQEAMDRRVEFQPRQARLVADAFRAHGVAYLYIGKAAAVLLGYPGTTQDIDAFLPRARENSERVLAALRELGFAFSAEQEEQILRAKDFIQIKSEPFDIDLIFAPDGIQSFEEADSRRIEQDGFRIASLRDIIASKRASARPKDFDELPRLEVFAEEYEKRNPRPLRSAHEIDRHRKVGG